MATNSRMTVLRHTGFRRLWLGDAFSQFGSQFSALAMPVLAVQLLSATEWEMGVLNAAGTAAFLLVGLPAGAWVDRMLKRRVMIAADIVRGVTLAIVPLLWVLGALQIWHLFAIAAVIGIATVFFDAAYQSYIPHLVPDAQVGDANSVLQATGEVARVGGPGIAGALLTVLAAPVLLLADAVGYLGSALAISTIRDGEVAAEKASRRPLHVEIAEGLRFVLGQPLIRSVAATTASFNLFSTLLFTLLPLFILRDLDLGPVVLGITLSAGAVGGLLGALATPFAVRWLGEGNAIVVSAIAGAAVLVFVPLAVLTPGYEIVLLSAAQFCGAFTTLVYNITQVTLRQRLCPPALLGRMNASIRTFIWGVMPIGALLAGWLGGAIGIVPTFWIAVVGTLLGCSFVAFSPLTGMRKLPVAADAER